VNKRPINSPKFILDACCGGRCFWFDKVHPNTIYQDNRIAERGHLPARPNHCVLPDVVCDFRKMPYDDDYFKLVVFDPPHLLSGGETGWLRKKYGILNKETWQEDLRAGFAECFRVLQDYGVLVFKWNEESVKIKDVLSLCQYKPLFGHPTAKHGKTKWCVFMKIPEIATFQEQTAIVGES
jgi:hypothetical protein